MSYAIVGFGKIGQALAKTRGSGRGGHRFLAVGLAEGRVWADVALAICGHRVEVDDVSAVDRSLARHTLIECTTI